MKHLIRFLLGLLGIAIVLLISGGIASVILALVAGSFWILTKGELAQEVLRGAYFIALIVPCILGIYCFGVVVQGVGEGIRGKDKDGNSRLVKHRHENSQDGLSLP